MLKGDLCLFNRDTANSADSPFIRPGSVPGNPRGTPTSDNSFQPRVPVIISVTSVANPRTSSAPWSSKMMAHKARAPQNMMYHKWKLPAPNDGLLTSASACRASPVPSPVASPGSSQISPALKAGVLLDLSTKNNERKPVQIILKPRLSNSQPVRPVARHPLPDLVTPKVIITPLPPRHSNGNGQLTSLLPLEPAKISVVEQPNEKCPPEGGGLKSQADPQLPARASPQIKPEINLTRSHVRRSLPALQATSSSYSQLTNRPDKSFRSIPSNVESAFQRVMPSNSTLMPYPSVQQRSMLLPFIYPGYLGPTFGIPNAVRPFRSVSPMPLPVHSLNAALFRPRTPYPCREAMLRQNEPVALLKGSSTPVWSGSLPLDRSAKSQPQSSKQSVNPTQVPIQSASLKGPGVKRALPGLMPISSCAAKKHPAPLPAHLNDQHQLLSQFFKPVVTIKRVPDGKLKLTFDTYKNKDVFCFRNRDQMDNSSAGKESAGRDNSLRVVFVPRLSRRCAVTGSLEASRKHPSSCLTNGMHFIKSTHPKNSTLTVQTNSALFKVCKRFRLSFHTARNVTSRRRSESKRKSFQRVNIDPVRVIAVCRLQDALYGAR